LQEYSQLSASELFFNPATLSVEDWELLMGEPGSEAVFARTIRHALVELRSSGQITLEQLEDRVLSMLVKQSRSAAQLRFDFIRRYLSSERGVDFEQVLQPGRVVIVDLRQPLFNKDDALRFFLVCANQVSQVQGRFNKLIIFDEAHEYLSDEFGERIEARIRQMRHEGTSYIFATQDVRSIPLAIRRFITTRFVFSLGTRENVDDLVRFAPEFKGQQLLGMPPGYCLAQANQSIDNVFERPRVVHIRPRVTKHGGATQIFSTGAHE
jgi:DNA helicase HerA-like ATPase